jgi:phage FluMu protein Com
MDPLGCTVCKYRTPIRCNFNKHLTTEKHKKNILNAPKMPVNAPKLSVNAPKLSVHAPIRSEITPRNPLACVHCDKVFTHKPSMQRHMNHRCKKNKQLNLIKQQQETIEIQKKHIETQQKILNQRPETINNTTNTTNNTVNIQNNTYILPYKDTDTSHLTKNDYAFCIKPDGVKRLIEKIHFNPMKPENQNLTITNLTDKYMMVYDGTQWKKVLKSELNKIYNHKEALLEEWVEQDPELREKFYEYIKTERKDVQIERIEAIKLMMYNQKPVAIV